MRSSYLPSSVSSILYVFAPCFTAPSFENFGALVVGWILCRGPHTVSRAIVAGRAFGLTRKHHASLYRFLSQARWVVDELGHAVFHLLLPFLPERIEAAVDDTLAHRTGPHIFGAGMHHDCAGSTYGGAGGRRVSFSFGHNWVVLSVFVSYPWSRIRGVAVPVLFRLYRPKKRCPEVLYRKRTELAAEMTGVLLSWLPEGRRLDLTGDGEYACGTLLGAIGDRAVFTGPLPMDAALYEPPPSKPRGRGRPPLKGPRLPSPREMALDPKARWTNTTVTLYGREVPMLVQTLTCLWYSVTGLRPVRVVLTRDPKGNYKDKAYFCTDPERPLEDVLHGYCRRWPLEVTFAQAKGCLGLEEPRNGWWRRPHGRRAPLHRAGPQPKGQRGSRAVRTTVPLIFTAYALVVIWYFRHGQPEADVARVRRERPWYVLKREPSYADMLGALRRELWRSRISRHPSLRAHRAKLMPLVAAAAGAA